MPQSWRWPKPGRRCFRASARVGAWHVKARKRPVTRALFCKPSRRLCAVASSSSYPNHSKGGVPPTLEVERSRHSEHQLSSPPTRRLGHGCHLGPAQRDTFGSPSGELCRQEPIPRPASGPATSRPTHGSGQGYYARPSETARHRSWRRQMEAPEHHLFQLLSDPKRLHGARFRGRHLPRCRSDPHYAISRSRRPYRWSTAALRPPSSSLGRSQRRGRVRFPTKALARLQGREGVLSFAASRDGFHRSCKPPYQARKPQ